MFMSSNPVKNCLHTLLEANEFCTHFCAGCQSRSQTGDCQSGFRPSDAACVRYLRWKAIEEAVETAIV